MLVVACSRQTVTSTLDSWVCKSATLGIIIGKILLAGVGSRGVLAAGFLQFSGAPRTPPFVAQSQHNFQHLLIAHQQPSLHLFSL